jgi:hypothetical protein
MGNAEEGRQQGRGAWLAVAIHAVDNYAPHGGEGDGKGRGGIRDGRNVAKLPEDDEC